MTFFNKTLFMWGLFLMIGPVIAKNNEGAFQPLNQAAPCCSFHSELNGEQSLAHFKGQPVLLAFWTTWCPQSQKFIKGLNEKASHFTDKNIKIIPLSLDFKGLPKVRSYFKKNQIDHLPVALDHTANFKRELDVHHLPTLFLISKEGRVIGRYDGIDIEDEATLNKIQAILNADTENAQGADEEENIPPAERKETTI